MIAADRQLLFGLLALQNGIVTQVQLVAAFQAWTLDKSMGLADHLEANGNLARARRALLEQLVDVHLEAHGGEVDQSLAAVAAKQLPHAGLAELGGPEIEAVIARIGGSMNKLLNDADDDRTTSLALGAATSNGQRFRVLRPHARGGLGAVFVALDSELNREVALKQILESHADDPSSRQRFVAEAEITGGLEHPGVVPVYGLGTYAGGRPYYAMRFIKGDSLKEAIERFHATTLSRGLELRRLLRRFLDVCNAIDYAHSRGVIHRDLKPANIILGKHGETLVVDWGLAKAVGRADPSVGEHTIAPSSGNSSETMPGSTLGTPAYMSPEQARGDLDRLGPRSDVYSLGATLYCQLTGGPPFEGDDIGALLRAVNEGRFQRPSQVDPSIDKALEAVCLKAMATRAEDRYPTARTLADDLERWMADEPVSAWREPFARRARRWARRNRTAVTSLAASIMVALIGTAAVLAVQTRANADLKSANLHLAAANERATTANASLQSANERERQRFDLAMEAIKLFHGEVGDDLVLKADQFKPLRDKLLRGAANFYGKLEILLKDQHDRASRGAMGNAYYELGTLTSKIGDRAAALAAHGKGLSIRRMLASEPDADADSRGGVARSLHAAAILMRQTGESAAALARFDEARELLESLPASGPGSNDRRELLGRIYTSIGVLLASTGKPAAATAAYGRSIETLDLLVREYPAIAVYGASLAAAQNNIGFFHVQSGRHDEALESYRSALAIQQKLVDDDPGNTDFLSSMALTHHNIGFLKSAIREPIEALESFRRGLTIRQKLAIDNPAVSEFRRRLADSFSDMASLQVQTGRTDEAMESYRHALLVRQKLVDDNPAVAGFQHALADAHTGMGWLLMQIGRPAAAVAEFAREESIRMKLVGEYPSLPIYQDRLANCETNEAAALLRLGRSGEARILAGRAISLRQSLVKDHPEAPAYRRGLGESLLRSGQARRDTGDVAGALDDWRHADAFLEGAGTLNPEFILIHACCHALLAGSAGRPGSGISRAQADREGAKAMVLLQSVANMGYSDLATYRTEIALDSLRDRPDFGLLMMDLQFPREPFAP